jgi:hypothetical protein
MADLVMYFMWHGEAGKCFLHLPAVIQEGRFQVENFSYVTGVNSVPEFYATHTICFRTFNTLTNKFTQ